MTRTRASLGVLTVATGLCFAGALNAAVIESSGGFVPGSTVGSTGTIQSQMAFGGGFSSSSVSSVNLTITGQAGPMAAIQNAPRVTEDRFNFSGSLGDTLSVSFADIATLSGIVEPDGEPLQFLIVATGGELRVDDVATAMVTLEEGQTFEWELPDSGNLSEFVMTIVARDVIAIQSSESPLGIEDADSISFTVTAGDSSVVDENNSADLGDAEVSVDSVSDEYTITNDTSLTTETSGLRRLNAETATWSRLQRRNALVVRRTIPPPSGRLTISSIDLGGANSSDFQLSGVTLPLILDPGDSATFTVTFSPQEPGDRLASIGFGRPGRPQGFFGFGVQGRGNRPPTGFDDEVLRPIGLEPIKIRLADLLANDRDIDGDMVRFGGFSTEVSALGRTIELLNDEWMIYYPGTPDEPQDDSFVYRVSDGRGATAPSVVFIREVNPNGQSGAIETTIAAGPGQPVTLRLRGVPGRRYRAQFTNQLNPPNTVWIDLGAPVIASPQNGGFEISDPQPPPGQRFYRIIEAPQQP